MGSPFTSRSPRSSLRESGQKVGLVRPRLLYTAGELREIRKLQAVAEVERTETSPGPKPADDNSPAGQEVPRE